MPRPHAGRDRHSRGGEAPAAAATPLHWRHPAFLITTLVAAAIALLAVTFRLTTPDFWQHLVVGKAIWQLGRIPQEHLWTWPSYGTHEVLPSWGFRWLLWPFWWAGQELGLQVWRWWTTLAAFGLAWAAARRLGARELMPLVVIAAAALSYRARAQIRPETLVAVLLALQLWVLERRRAAGARGGAIALLVIAWAWANVHISYFVGLALLGIHTLARSHFNAVSAKYVERRDSLAPGIRGLLGRVDRMPWALVLLLAVAVSFANPYGWRALWQPFEYFLIWRHEPIYKTIPELTPLYLTWRASLRSGLPILVALWPLLIAVRATRRRFDLVEALTCVLFTGLALFNQRFVGFLMIAIVPYVSRSLSEFAHAWAPPPFRSPWPRAAAAIAVMVLASLPSWTDTRFKLGIGIVPTLVPGGASDFIQAHGIRGRMFNPFYFGGYLAWRFWPDRARLPFMDIHQTGTRRDRELYAYAFANKDAWDALMQEHDFEVAVLDGHQEWVRGDRLLDVLDADPRWALVFRDDAAALYVRRDGPLAAIAESYAYRVMPGGNEALVRAGPSVFGDPVARRALRAELRRRLTDSPLNAQAHSLLANLDFIENHRDHARTHLLDAITVDPTLATVHRRLGYLYLSESRWRDGIRELEAELRLGVPPENAYYLIGEAWEKLGDKSRALRAYRRAVDVRADDAEASAAVERLEKK